MFVRLIQGLCSVLGPVGAVGWFVGWLMENDRLMFLGAGLWVFSDDVRTLLGFSEPIPIARRLSSHDEGGDADRSLRRTDILRLILIGVRALLFIVGCFYMTRGFVYGDPVSRAIASALWFVALMIAVLQHGLVFARDLWRWLLSL